MEKKMPANPKKLVADAKEELAIEEIRKALRSLKYGTITIIVQDGVVIQIDRTSKTRIDYSTLFQVSGGEGI
jgi:hypothetical protein